jgi:hypothetical protein
MKRSIVGLAALVMLSGGVGWAKAGYIALNYPGAFSTTALGVSGHNVIGYYAVGSQTLGFLYDGKNYKTIDPNGSTYTYATAVSGKNVVGFYVDAAGNGYGYPYDGKSYTTLNYPGSIFTYATGVSGHNVVGNYLDAASKTHGFLFDGTTYKTLDPSVPWHDCTWSLRQQGGRVLCRRR